MAIKIPRYKPLFEQESLYEMSNLFPKKTGLKYVIWITIGSGGEKHGARIKVYDNDGVVSITISNNPKIMKVEGKPKIKKTDISDIKTWIIQNKETLLMHWKGEIDSADLGKKIQKLKRK